MAPDTIGSTETRPIFLQSIGTPRSAVLEATVPQHSCRVKKASYSHMNSKLLRVDELRVMQTDNLILLRALGVLIGFKDNNHTGFNRTMKTTSMPAWVLSVVYSNGTNMLGKKCWIG